MSQRETYLSTAWRKSSYSSANACVEVAIFGDRVAVRDSKRGDTPVLCFTETEWQAFIGGVRDGELTIPRDYS
jgi:Domain of unknown function (DUF397)